MKKKLSHLYFACAVLYLVAGLVMIIFDEWNMRAVQYIVCLVVLFLATPVVNTYLDPWGFKDPIDSPLMNLGFICLCIGITMDTIGIWGLGFISFITGFIRREVVTIQ